jgi:hypothetical protein
VSSTITSPRPVPGNTPPRGKAYGTHLLVVSQEYAEPIFRIKEQTQEREGPGRKEGHLPHTARCLNMRPVSGGTAPRILKLGTRWRRAVCFEPGTIGIGDWVGPQPVLIAQSVQGQGRIEKPGFDSRQGEEMVLFSITTRSALESTRHPTQHVSLPVSPGVKWPEREADHSSLLRTVEPYLYFPLLLSPQHRDVFAFATTRK